MKRLSTHDCTKMIPESSIIVGKKFLQEYLRRTKVSESEESTEFVEKKVDHSMYAQVTYQREKVFVSNESRDRYTGWTKGDYGKHDELDSSYDHPAKNILGV